MRCIARIKTLVLEADKRIASCRRTFIVCDERCFLHHSTSWNHPQHRLKLIIHATEEDFKEPPEKNAA